MPFSLSAADPREYRFCVRRLEPMDGFNDLPTVQEWLAQTGHRCQTSHEVVDGHRCVSWRFENYTAAHGFMRAFGGEPWEDASQRRRAS